MQYRVGHISIFYHKIYISHLINRRDKTNASEKSALLSMAIQYQDQSRGHKTRQESICELRRSEAATTDDKKASIIRSNCRGQ